MVRVDNLLTGALIEQSDQRLGVWRELELDGERIGVRVEELLPGAGSSVHHWHTAEEEHVIVLAGTATLHDGAEQQTLREGDHVCFRAGSGRPHHIENTSAAPFRFLVFGERNPHDLVVYPDHQVMRVKAIDEGLVTYRPLSPESVAGHQEQNQEQHPQRGQQDPHTDDRNADDD